MPEPLNDTLRTLYSHQSVRNFLDKPLTDEQVEAITQAVRQTSSACFFQTVTVIRVSDKALLAELGKGCGGTMRIDKCAQFWMFCADYTRLARILPLKQPVPFKLFFHTINDCSMACQSALTAAESLGLGGVAIGGFKRDIKRFTELLKLPKLVAPVLGLCLGVPDPDYLEEQKPRLPESFTFMDNTWHDSFDPKAFAQYEETFRQYYLHRKHNAKDEPWSLSCKAMLDKDHCLQEEGEAEQGAAEDPLIVWYRSCGINFG